MYVMGYIVHHTDTLPLGAECALLEEALDRLDLPGGRQVAHEDGALQLLLHLSRRRQLQQMGSKVE